MGSQHCASRGCGADWLDKAQSILSAKRLGQVSWGMCPRKASTQPLSTPVNLLSAIDESCGRRKSDITVFSEFRNSPVVKFFLTMPEGVLFSYRYQNTKSVKTASLTDFVEADCSRALLCKLLPAEPY